MNERSVRDLKARASEMLRHVREERARYIITYRGKAVAVLAPLDHAATEAEGPAAGDAWDELVRLRAQIGRRWRVRQSSVDLLSRMRR
jgi:prevent-host-death family protein